MRTPSFRREDSLLRTWDLKRVRILLWLGWPVTAVVLGVSVLHFLRYQVGWEIYWSWNVPHVVQAIVALLVPPAVIEVLIRNVRNNGQ
jgi:hypothetical protein